MWGKTSWGKKSYTLPALAGRHVLGYGYMSRHVPGHVPSSYIVKIGVCRLCGLTTWRPVFASSTRRQSSHSTNKRRPCSELCGVQNQILSGSPLYLQLFWVLKQRIVAFLVLIAFSRHVAVKPWCTFEYAQGILEHLICSVLGLTGAL